MKEILSINKKVVWKKNKQWYHCKEWQKYFDDGITIFHNYDIKQLRQGCTGRKTDSPLKLHTTDCFWEKATGMCTLELHSLANMVIPKQMALHQPGYLLQKDCALKAPTDLYNLAKSQVSYKERTKSTIFTKNHISKWTCTIS